MVFVTGDYHSDIDRFVYECTHAYRDFTAQDVLLVAGDFGFVFATPQDKEFFAAEQAAFAQLEQAPFTIAFCDGNHENFARLETLPVEQWCGAPVHRVGKNIVHLMRGEIYEIEGQSVFVMGGAYSMDKGSRVPGISWWARELPDEEEYARAIENLARRGNRVDYVLTHTAPLSMIYAMHHAPDGHDLRLTRFLHEIWIENTFKHWYYGHWHIDKNMNDTPNFCTTALFEKTVPLGQALPPEQETGE